MLSRSASLAVLLGVSFAAMPAFGQGKGKGNNSAAAQNGWIFSLSEGKRRATESGKPLMVVIRCEP